MTATAVLLRPASGRRGAEADDARTREVGPRHSSDEAGEQNSALRYGAIRERARCSGVGGAKGGDQGECGLAKHAPDTEPGERVTGAGTHTAGGKQIILPFIPEVGAVCGKAARTVLCGGRAMKRTSLPLRDHDHVAHGRFALSMSIEEPPGPKGTGLTLTAYPRIAISDGSRHGPPE